MGAEQKPGDPELEKIANEGTGGQGSSEAQDLARYLLSQEKKEEKEQEVGGTINTVQTRFSVDARKVLEDIATHGTGGPWSYEAEGLAEDLLQREKEE